MAEREWLKSSFSEEGGNNCVEVTEAGPEGIAIRESAEPGHAMTTCQAAFRLLLETLKAAGTIS